MQEKSFQDKRKLFEQAAQAQQQASMAHPTKPAPHEAKGTGSGKPVTSMVAFKPRPRPNAPSVLPPKTVAADYTVEEATSFPASMVNEPVKAPPVLPISMNSSLPFNPKPVKPFTSMGSFNPRPLSNIPSALSPAETVAANYTVEETTSLPASTVNEPVKAPPVLPISMDSSLPFNPKPMKPFTSMVSAKPRLLPNVPSALLPKTVAAAYSVEEATSFPASTVNKPITTPILTPPNLAVSKDLPLTLPQQTFVSNHPTLNNLVTIKPKPQGKEGNSSLNLLGETKDEEQEIADELEVIDPFAHAPRLPTGAIKIGKVLGHGAFGEVYQGDWQGRPVALKKIDLVHAKKSLPKLDENQILESLQWEVSRLSTVSHPQLVSFYGIYEIDKVIYLTMEFCLGGDLQKRLAKGDVSWSKRWQWALEMAQGLAYLHEQGVLHRDLKAENILLDANGRAKLADLGVAQVDALLQNKEAKVVADGLQDKRFIAPENVKNPTLSSKETDVYALGLVFWQLVTGQVPRRLHGYDLRLILVKDKLPEKNALKEAPVLIKMQNNIGKASFFIYGISGGKPEFTALKDIEQLRLLDFNQNTIFISSTRNKEIYEEIRLKKAHTASDLSLAECQAWQTGKGLREPIPSDCPDSFRQLILACWAHEPNQRIKLDALVKQLKQLAKELHPEPQIAMALESLDQLLHSKRVAGLVYVPSLVTQHPVRELLDTYWRRWEINQSSKEEAKFVNPPLKLADTFEQFLQQPGGGTLLLLGESGLGKTLSVYQWIDHLMQQGWRGLAENSKKALGYLPLLVRPALAQWTQADLKDGLAKTLAFYGLPMNFPQPVLLIIDGYDECMLNDVPVNIAQQLGIPPQSPIKVVITCRPETILEHERNGRFASSNQLQTVYFLPFSLEQLFQYMSRHLLWSEETQQTYQKALIDNTTLRAVLRNPFVLSLCVDSWAIVSKKDVSRLNRWQIYDSFVEHVLLTHSNVLSARVKKQLGGTEDNLLVYFNQTAAYVAFELFRHKGLVLKAGEAKQVTDSAWLDIEGRVAQDSQRRFRLRQKALAAKNKFTQTTKRSLLSEADYVAIQLWRARQFMQYLPLRHKTVGYEFSHKSFFEYFAAKRLVALIPLSSIEIEQTAQHLLADRSVQEEPQLLAFWVEGWQAAQSQALIEPLFNVVTASRNNPQGALAASNAATLLAKASVSTNASVCFWRRDLRQVAIPDADLSDAYCFGTQFQGADLRGVNFTRTCLNEANLIDANMEEVEFGELPSLINESRIYCLGYSPDGTILASGSYDNIVRLWDVHRGAEKTVLKGHTRVIYSVAFSSDGAMIASGSKDNTVRLWDVHRGIGKAILTAHTNGVRGVAFSPDGAMLASGSDDNTIRLWDIHTGTEKAVLTAHTDGVQSVVFSPDGTTLASGGGDCTVRLWDIHTGTEKAVLTAHTDWVNSVAFSPDGTTLASGSGDYTVCLWDAKYGTNKVVFIGHVEPVVSVTFSHDGTMLASGSHDDTARLWDVHSGSIKAILSGHMDIVNSVVFSPDDKMLVSGSGDHSIHFWNINKATQEAVVNIPKPGHTNCIWSLAFSPDGATLASGAGLTLYSNDNTVRLWDTRSGVEKSVLKGHTERVSSVVFSPNGKMLASGSNDSTIRLWDLHSGTEKAVLRNMDQVISLAFSADSETLVCGVGNPAIAIEETIENTVGFWDIKNGIEKASMKHKYCVFSVALSSDGTMLASASGNPDNPYENFDGNIVRIWDIKNGIEKAIQKPILRHKHCVFSVAFSSDSKILASGGVDTALWLWDVNKCSNIAILKGHKHYVFSVAFNPDGAMLASGGGDCTVRLWNVVKATEKAVLTGHTREVRTVTFSSDGATLASGGVDFAFFLWKKVSYSDTWRVIYRISGKGTGLLAQGVHFKGATLSENNRQLLKKLGDYHSEQIKLSQGKFDDDLKNMLSDTNTQYQLGLSPLTSLLPQLLQGGIKNTKPNQIQSVSSKLLSPQTINEMPFVYQNMAKQEANFQRKQLLYPPTQYQLGMYALNPLLSFQPLQHSVTGNDSSTTDDDSDESDDSESSVEADNTHIYSFRLAANRGDADAQYNLGECYYNGRGVAQDLKEAVRYYRLAAAQGHANAQCNLGNCYYYGRGVKQDLKEAVHYYRLAAKQEYVDAQYSLGCCYEKGQGVAQDLKEAVRYYRLAAVQEYASAQRALGEFYYDGIGVDKDFKEAARYYNLAADRGDAVAQCSLGVCYYHGQGVAQDLKEAVRYFRLAAAQGRTDAQRYLNHLLAKHPELRAAPPTLYQFGLNPFNIARKRNSQEERGERNFDRFMPK